MTTYQISANQLAQFATATKAAKKRILKQQIIPNPFLIPWYQKAKGGIKKYLSNVADKTPLEDAITFLKKRIPENDRQKIDIRVSIEALEVMKKIRLPKILSEIKYEVLLNKKKSITINNVDIKLAPELIIKGKYKGEDVYGAIKIHICKGAPFDLNQSRYVSTLIYRYLKKEYNQSGERILPELCISLDVFGERVVSAPATQFKDLIVIKKICEEVKELWPR